MRYFIFLMLFSTSFSYADVYGSAGYSDPLHSGTGTALQLGWEENLPNKRPWYSMPWVASVEYFTDRTSEYDDGDNHFSISGGKKLFEPCWGNLCLYGDLGLALHSDVSAVNSSRITTFEHLGVTYKQVRLYFRHTSNAGIKGQNIGENSIFIGYTF